MTKCFKEFTGVKWFNFVLVPKSRLSKTFDVPLYWFRLTSDKEMKYHLDINKQQNNSKYVVIKL